MGRENALAEDCRDYQKIHCLFIVKVIRLLEWRVIIAVSLWTFVYRVNRNKLTSCCVGLIPVAKKEQQQEISYLGNSSCFTNKCYKKEINGFSRLIV